MNGTDHSIGEDASEPQGRGSTGVTPHETTMLKSATPRGTVLTATLMLVAQVASAQEPVHSFQQLSVKAGQQIVVKPNDGRTSTWIVVSTAGDQLQVERRRWTFKIERRVFTEQSAARIDLRDSTLNGLLIGTGVGLLGAVVIERTCRDLACLLPFVLSIGMGPGLGKAIDATVNRTIYTPNQGTRVTFSPEFGSRRLGLNARIRFGSRP